MINLLRLLHRLPHTLADLSGRLAHAELRLDALERPTVAPAPQPTPEPAREPGDCWTCAHDATHECAAPVLPEAWICAHLGGDGRTRRPAAPPCPAWRAK